MRKFISSIINGETCPDGNGTLMIYYDSHLKKINKKKKKKNIMIRTSSVYKQWKSIVLVADHI